MNTTDTSQDEPSPAPKEVRDDALLTVETWYLKREPYGFRGWDLFKGDPHGYRNYPKRRLSGRTIRMLEKKKMLRSSDLGFGIIIVIFS